jgi:hypothetical protein
MAIKKFIWILIVTIDFCDQQQWPYLVVGQSPFMHKYEPSFVGAKEAASLISIFNDIITTKKFKYILIL